MQCRCVSSATWTNSTQAFGVYAMGTSDAACMPPRMAATAIGACSSHGVQISATSATSSDMASIQASGVPVKTRGADFWNSAICCWARLILAGLMSLMAVISAWPSCTSQFSMSMRLWPRLPNPKMARRTREMGATERSKALPVSPAVLILVARTSSKEAASAGRVNELSTPPSPSKPPTRRKSSLRMFRR